MNYFVSGVLQAPKEVSVKCIPFFMSMSPSRARQLSISSSTNSTLVDQTPLLSADRADILRHLARIKLRGLDQ